MRLTTQQGWMLTGVIVVLAIGTKTAITYAGSRGLRNNNPGNIEKSSVNQWQGATSSLNGTTDTQFVQFVSPEYGIRAIARILKNYASQGVTTVPAIIGKWAPPSKNDTDAYIKAVLKRTGWLPTRQINVTDYPALIAAITRQENGSMPYTQEQLRRGVSLS